MKKLFSRILKRSLDEYSDFTELLRYKRIVFSRKRIPSATVGYAPTPDWMLFDVDICIIQAVYLFIIHVMINGCQQTTICIWTESESTRCRSVVRLRHEGADQILRNEGSRHARARHAHRSPVTITHYSRIVAFVWSTIR